MGKGKGKARLKSCLKYHGGKHHLAPRIAALFPAHTHYVEPFFGSGAVMLAKDPEGVSEVANDIDGRLMNFWAVLQSGCGRDALVELLVGTPFSQEQFRWAARQLARGCEVRFPEGCVSCAHAFFVVCRQSMAGRQQEFSPLSRTRTRRGMNEQAAAWITAAGMLPEVHGRLRRVALLNLPALEVMEQEDGEGTLHYLDPPPYVPGTRASPQVYRHEMTDSQHFDLVSLCRTLKGKVALSGYPNAMYDEVLKAWNRHDFDLPNHSAKGPAKGGVTERLWVNW